jgi:magnesium-protoporphyrin O-methyltransferase
VPSSETEGISECFDRCGCAKAKRARPRAIRAVSRLLLDLLDRRGLGGRTVLEPGCGFGGLSRATVTRGATRATGLDLSPIAIGEATRLANEAGLAERVTFTVGDAAQVELLASDVVVLDKVICCYPEVDALLQNTVRATGSTYAFAVPFSRGFRGALARAVISSENAFRRIRRRAFRAYVHDVKRIESILARAGFERVASARRTMWYVAVHERSKTAKLSSFSR